MFLLPMPRDRFETGTSWVLLTIVVLDAILLIPSFGAGRELFFARYGFVPAHPTWLTCFSAIFLHVGLLHYIGNMWFLWIFGRKVERVLGHVRFAAIFLASGVGGQCLHMLFNLHSAMPLVGASGAISGVAGVYFVLFAEDRFFLHLYLGYWRVKTYETRARAAVGAWIGEQTLLGLLTRLSLFTSVAFWAHVGGFAVGALGVMLFAARVPREEQPASVMVAEGLGEGETEQPSELVSLNLR